MYWNHNVEKNVFYSTSQSNKPQIYNVPFYLRRVVGQLRDQMASQIANKSDKSEWHYTKSTLGGCCYLNFTIEWIKVWTSLSLYLSNSSKSGKLNEIHNLNVNVFNLSLTQERRWMGCGCYSSKKLGGCQRGLGRLCRQLGGPLWQMGRFKRPQGHWGSWKCLRGSCGAV